MKNFITAFLICCFILVSMFLPFSQKANAVGDPLTIEMLASATAAIGQSWGITFSSNWTAIGAQNMLEQEIKTYSEGNIVKYFGREAIRLNAGKLIVGQLAYNGIINFLRDLSKKYNLGENQATIGFMFANSYLQLGLNIDSETITGFYTDCVPGTRYNLVYWNGPNGYRSSGGGDIPISYSHISTPIYTVLSNGIRSSTLMANDLGATRTHNTTITYAQMRQITGETYNIPVIASSSGILDNATVLNPNEHWEGIVDGWEGPDTNLDQLMDDIFEDVADTNLDVEGEVVQDIDPPLPSWEPVDDVIDGINQGGDVLTDIGNDIGDISGQLDNIGELVQDQTDAIEGIQEGVGELTDAVAGVSEGISDIASGLSDALSVPTADDISDYRFDLSNLFPFCIPFDIVRMLRAFDGVAAAPHFQIPIQIRSIGFNYTMDLDFAIFDPVATVLRQVELIAFGIALAFATSKVIRW